MPDSKVLVDEALRIGRLELKCLQDKDVDCAGYYASERGEIMRKAFNASTKDLGHDFLSRVKELRDLHGVIVEEAVALQGTLREELAKIKTHSRGFSGYKRTGQCNSMPSRFVSKIG